MLGKTFRKLMGFGELSGVTYRALVSNSALIMAIPKLSQSIKLSLCCGLLAPRSTQVNSVSTNSSSSTSSIRRSSIRSSSKRRSGSSSSSSSSSNTSKRTD